MLQQPDAEASEQVLLVRTDLKMDKGKIAAQCRCVLCAFGVTRQLTHPQPRDARMLQGDACQQPDSEYAAA